MRGLRPITHVSGAINLAQSGAQTLDERVWVIIDGVSKSLSLIRFIEEPEGSGVW